MKRALYSIPILISLTLAGCLPTPTSAPLTAEPAAPTAAPPPATTEPTPAPLAQPAPAPAPIESLQWGLNFIRFFEPEGRGEALDYQTPEEQPEFIYPDFRRLGAQAMRQLVTADLSWSAIEARDNEWTFEAADRVLMHPERSAEPIVTLFLNQYASPTPPWAGAAGQFRTEMGPEARDYVETVVRRYAPYVRYWEIGNEMDHWRAADPGNELPAGLSPESAPPANALEVGFSPQQQGRFLAEVAQIIRANDFDAVILMPGMGGLSDYTLNTWFAGVIEGGGAEWFDVVNYHYYSPWTGFERQRRGLQQFLLDHGLEDRPVWNTETGISSDPSLTLRTDYPNSEAEQAAELFRRPLLAWAAGDDLVLWHTYIGSREDDPNNAWRAYGVRSGSALEKPSYAAYRLLSQELIPFARVERVDARGQQLFRVTRTDGSLRWVAWGQGDFVVPDGLREHVSVVPDGTGAYTWASVQAGQVIPLSDTPILLR